jgi:hypothetical protein
MNQDDKVPERFKKLVPPRGSLAASMLARVIKDLRRRKIKPFYYEARELDVTKNLH